MKRAPFVLTGTACGLVGILGYHTAASTSLPSTSSAVSQTTTSAATTATSTGSSASKSTSSRQRTATGEDINYQYGDLQLKVTVSGSRITSVSVAQLNVNDPRSQSIDQAAIPQLQQEALSAQSAKIDAVSGASYTSQAYEQSLQSALDKLGFTSASA
jgi:uncharacterized protein with FMN-binding domain